MRGSNGGGIIVGVGGIMALLISTKDDNSLFYDKLVATVFFTLFFLGLFPLSVDWMYRFVDRNKMKEAIMQREQQDRIEKVRNELKNIYLNEIIKKDESKLLDYNEISDKYKGLYLEIIFDRYIRKPDNLEFLKNLYKQEGESNCNH